MNGVLTLESGLSITMLESTGYEGVSVTCQNNNWSTNATIILQVEVHEQGIINVMYMHCTILKLYNHGCHAIIMNIHNYSSHA